MQRRKCHHSFLVNRTDAENENNVCSMLCTSMWWCYICIYVSGLKIRANGSILSSGHYKNAVGTLKAGSGKSVLHINSKQTHWIHVGFVWLIKSARNTLSNLRNKLLFYVPTNRSYGCMYGQKCRIKFGKHVLRLLSHECHIPIQYNIEIGVS